MSKKGIITIGLILTTFLTLPFSSYAVIQIQAADQMYETVEEVEAKDMALVLGAAVYPSRLSDILKDRMDTAIELYQAGKVKGLIVSGGVSDTGSEAEAMANYAIANGVPTEVIVQDSKGTNTYASIQNVENTEESLVIVTQKYHLPRALFLAGSRDIEAVGMIADKQPYLKIEEYKERELWATSKAVFDVFFLSGE